MLAAGVSLPRVARGSIFLGRVRPAPTKVKASALHRVVVSTAVDLLATGSNRRSPVTDHPVPEAYYHFPFSSLPLSLSFLLLLVYIILLNSVAAVALWWFILCCFY